LFLKKKYRIGFCQLISLVLFGLLSVFLFYDPISSLQSGSTFIFKPFALVHPIIEDPSLFYLKNITNARYYLIEQNKLSPRLIIIEAFSLLLFLFFNFGTRILGFIYLIFKSIKKKVEEIEVYVFLTILFSVFLTIFFIQKGEWWNTIQFFYYALFLSNIFISKFLYELIKKKKIIGIITSLIIIIATIPVNIDILKSFVTFPSQYYISKDEIISQLRDLLIEYESDLLAGKYTKECGEPRGVHTETLYWDSMIHSNTIFDKEFRMGDVAVFYPAKSAGGKPLPKNKNIALEYGDDPTDFGVDIDFKDVLRKLKKSIEKILNGIEPGTTWESICDNLKQGSFDDNDDLW